MILAKILVKSLKTSALLSLFCFINTGISLGQVGIGTQDPHTSAVLDVNSNNKGMLIPKLTSVERNTIANPATGLMLYNKTRRCLEVNEGTPASPNWVCITKTEFILSVGASCENNGFEGEFVNSITLPSGSGHKFSVTILNNYSEAVDFTFSTSDITLSGIEGLSVLGVSHTTLSLVPGESQKIEYTLRGTPSSTGELHATWNNGGIRCTKSVNISSDENTYAFSSDTYVFSYTDPATSTDIQGVLNNDTIIAAIPYSSIGSSGTPYMAYSGSWYTLFGEGDTNSVRLSYDGGTLNTTDSLKIKLEVDGDNKFLVSKLTSGQNSILLSLPLVVNGTTVKVTIKVFGGIPDRNFAADTNHMFIYTPILAADGSVWLNNNLGAHYSDINHPQFNPIQQATSTTDYNAYGSLFQWGRYSDGHELINYSNSTTGVGVNGNTSVNATSNTPDTNLFIIEVNTPFDWRVPQNNNLWQSGVNAINNPCPEGYYIPTSSEFSSTLDSENVTNIANAQSSSLALTGAIRLGNSGAVRTSATDNTARYWTSTVSNVSGGIYSEYLWMNNTSGRGIYRANRVAGLLVRCKR